MDDDFVLDFKDIESKLGRKIPESLMRSLWQGRCKEAEDETPLPATPSEEDANASKSLQNKMLFLKREMAHLRAIDIKLMQQLLSINDGIESIKWVMEEKGSSGDSSLAGSFCSLLDSPGTSQRGSCHSLQAISDGSDGVSIGSYLDTLVDDLPSYVPVTDLDNFSHQLVAGDVVGKPSLGKDKKADLDTYYSFR